MYQRFLSSILDSLSHVVIDTIVSEVAIVILMSKFHVLERQMILVHANYMRTTLVGFSANTGPRDQF